MDNEEQVDEMLFVEEEKPVESSKRKSAEKITALRISSIQRGAVMFKGEQGGVAFFRLVPVDVWNGGEEQEFELKEFMGFPKPAFAKR